MIAFIDTNVFLRFLVPDKKNKQLSQKAKIIFSLIEKRELQVQTNIVVIFELFYVLTKFYKEDKKLVIEKILNILDLEDLIVEHKDWIITAFSYVTDYNVDFADAYAYVEMKNNGITEIITFDQKHFNRLSGVTIHPLSFTS